MRTIWKEMPRPKKRPKKNGAWVGLYVTLSPRGAIVMNRVTWEKTGCPLAYQIFFDDSAAPLAGPTELLVIQVNIETDQFGII